MLKKNETETQKTFMLQLRVVRAFKSTLEDIEDRRSIHSLRSLRNMQNPAAGYAWHGFIYQKGLKSSNQQHGQSSNCDNIFFTVPKTPLNLNEINARYMDDDDDDRTNTNTIEQSIETRI